MTFSIVATHHTSFTVSDIERSVAFFRDALGFTIVHREDADPALVSGLSGVRGADARLAFIQAPGHTIELVEYRAPAERGRVACRPCDSGAAHIAFVVDDIDAVMAAMRAAGLDFVGAPQTVADGPGAGARAVYMRDRDGIQFEFIQMPK